MADSLMFRKFIPTAAALTFAFSLTILSGISRADAVPIDHRLEILLFPEEQKLAGRDFMRIRVDDRRELSFHLSNRAQVKRILLNGEDRAVRFSNSEIILPVEPREHGQTVEVELIYEAIFNDPVPVDPANVDNPGFGVTATITKQGVFLLSGAGWYPELKDSRATFRLTVKAPLNILAVTAGRSLGHKAIGDTTVSEWLIEHPVEGLTLSAAAYEIHEQNAGDVIISLYLFPESRPLGSAYMKAAADYVRFYSDLFGPYPFPKFAVVENFFPTGYGFPSYTLLGSSVLRLPFLIQTSLGHEIAHSWWGNGVYVDYDLGNWSEGLTTYVSDYLYKERESEAEAREYRLQAIRNYTTLAPPGTDFPLSEFTGRVDPLSKAIGYDKGAMVFHMLRRTVGEQAFWTALRELYRSRLFLQTSWKDIQSIFETQSKMSLERFFDQWVFRKGAPQIYLENVRAVPGNGNWKIVAGICQESEQFNLNIDGLLECETSRTMHKIALSDDCTRLNLDCSSSPRRLALDPDFDLLRRLDPAEIPPAVNLLKSSPSALLVLPSGSADPLKTLAGTLALGLGLEEYQIVSEKDLEPELLSSRDIILIGMPMNEGLLPRMPAGIRLEKGRFTLDGQTYQNPSDSFFGVFRHPAREGRVVAVFHPLSMKDAGIVARKVTHYGRYSYVTFHGGENREKGFWPVEDSPVVHEFVTRKGAP